jgi:hypothetical protein
MDALLFLAMLAALIAGCFWFVFTLPKQEPTYCARCMSDPEIQALLTQGRDGARVRRDDRTGSSPASRDGGTKAA